ncbi:hypothetical protein [Absidia glauca]|uniref:Zn(2)-C6 fungal-type domain-containing protein n=1 Tax=Absidia glauca TaxID=4829 RepID=A0A168RKH3_ABSGL|nr:hypothetical protein [Absidia glauca]
MSSHPTRSDQSDPTITSSATGFDQLHAGLRWQPDQQQQHQQLAIQQQQQQEGGLTLQCQHGQHGQQVGSDLPQSMRRIQPQPNSSTPIAQTHNAFVYPHSSNSPLLHSVHSPEETPENDHDMKRLRVSRACDGCRRKKIKCNTDGLGSTCRSCNSANTVCTFKDRYIEVLENRLKRMEQLIGGIAENKASTATTNQTHNNETVTSDGGSTALSPSSSSSSLSPPPPPPLPSAASPQTPNSAPLLSSTNDLPTLVGTSNSVMAKLTPPDGNNSERCPDFGTPTPTSNNTSTNVDSWKTRRPSIAEIHPRYIADLTTLPFLAQKFDVEDDRFASSVGVKIRRFGRSLVLYEEGDATTGRTPNQYLLEKLGLLKPDEAIPDVDDWISKVAGITKDTSDRLMKV